MTTKQLIGIADYSVDIVQSTVYRDVSTIVHSTVKRIDKNFRETLFKQATTECTSVIALGRKKNGFFQFCIDFHRLDAVVIRGSYQLPRMDESST